MFPIRDENPSLSTPVVTIGIIGINLLAWFLLQGAGFGASLTESICRFGIIPAEFFGRASGGEVMLGGQMFCELGGLRWVTPLTSMFMHGGWFHLIGNMWFLWVFGDNVEDIMGRTRFVVFYVLCGLAAAMAQAFTDPNSLVPMVGASGAIGGVMGAYARKFPKVPVHTLIFLGFLITTVSLPAIFMLGYWFLLQVVGGLPGIGGSSGGVAFWAHIGGFLAGLALVGPLTDPKRIKAREQLERRRGSRHRLWVDR